MKILMDIDEVGHVLGIIGKGFPAGPLTTDKVAFICCAYLLHLHSTGFILLASGSESMITVEGSRKYACID